MSDNNINRAIHRARGLCWHELRTPFLGAPFVCRHCGQGCIADLRQDNPSYDSDISACLGPGGLVEWMTSKDRGGRRVDVVIRITDGMAHVSIHRVPLTRCYNPPTSDESLPKAIATAAYKALGLEVGE